MASKRERDEDDAAAAIAGTRPATVPDAAGSASGVVVAVKEEPRDEVAAGSAPPRRSARVPRPAVKLEPVKLEQVKAESGSSGGDKKATVSAAGKATPKSARATPKREADVKDEAKPALKAEPAPALVAQAPALVAQAPALVAQAPALVAQTPDQAPAQAPALGAQAPAFVAQAAQQQQAAAAPPLNQAHGRVNLGKAMRLYAMTREELKALPHAEERNPISPLAAPTLVFSHEVVRAASEAKWAAKDTTLAAALAKRAETGAKRAATIKLRRDEARLARSARMDQLVAAFRANGVPPATALPLPACSAFVDGTAGATFEAAVAAAVAQHAAKSAAEREQLERAERVRERSTAFSAALTKRGLNVPAYTVVYAPSIPPLCKRFVEGDADVTLAAAVEAAASHAERVATRRPAFAAALAARGLDEAAAAPYTVVPSSSYYLYDISAGTTMWARFLKGDEDVTLDAAVTAAVQDRDAKAEAVRMIEERRAALSAALQARGIELRTDSQLCQLYISGSPQAWTLEATADKMVDMHILYAHTNYKNREEQAYSYSREAFREERYDDYDDYGRGGRRRRRYDDYDDGGDFLELWRAEKESIQAECLAQYHARVQQGGPDMASAALCKCGRPFLPIKKK